MPRRKSSVPTVQPKLRIKKPLHAELDRAAKRRGVSLNSEMVDRLESGTLVYNLAEGEFGLTDLALFRDYVQTIKIGIGRAGEDEGYWLGYAREVPFPLGVLTTEQIFAALQKAVDNDHREDEVFMRTYIDQHGGPPPSPDERNVATRRARTTASAENAISPEVEFHLRSTRHARVERNRRAWKRVIS